jgi:large subunit ribosomal protein L21
MKYAVLETGGKQYMVEEGDVIEVEKIAQEAGKQYIFDKILLVSSDEGVTLGYPYIEGINIVSEILEQKKGEKVRVAKFKAKSRYRRVNGHRQLLTSVKISSIKMPQAKKVIKEETKVDIRPKTQSVTKKAEPRKKVIKN